MNYNFKNDQSLAAAKLTRSVLRIFALFAGGTALLTGCGNAPATTPAPSTTATAPAPTPTTTASASPTFSPAPGVYTTAQTITLADSTAGAAIYYTTDGSTPTTSSTKYAGPITADSTTTINAIAAASGYDNSAPATATYTINVSSSSGTPTQPAPTPPAPAPPAPTPPAPPAPTPPAPAPAGQLLTIADATPGAVIYYTTDGSTPTTSSTRYIGPITVDNPETVQAIAIASGFSTSTVSEIAIGASGQQQAAPPAFSISTGTYSTPQNVVITDSTPGTALYYTTDGSTPTAKSAQYTAPVTVSSSETLNAIAIAAGYTNSAVATAIYTITSSTSSASVAANLGAHQR